MISLQGAENQKQSTVEERGGKVDSICYCNKGEGKQANLPPVLFTSPGLIPQFIKTGFPGFA